MWKKLIENKKNNKVLFLRKRKLVVKESVKVFEKDWKIASKQRASACFLPVYGVSYYHLNRLFPKVGVSLDFAWGDIPKSKKTLLKNMLKKSVLLSKEDLLAAEDRILVNLQKINNYRSQRHRTAAGGSLNAKKLKNRVDLLRTKEKITT